MDGSRLKYLEFLQAIVGRMAGNQFSVRTWSIALGTTMIAFAAAGLETEGRADCRFAGHRFLAH